jgi:hypothetical protein
MSRLPPVRQEPNFCDLHPDVAGSFEKKQSQFLVLPVAIQQSLTIQGV